MKSTIRRSQRDYSLAFKLSVIDQVERGELTYKKALAERINGILKGEFLLRRPRDLGTGPADGG